MRSRTAAEVRPAGIQRSEYKEFWVELEVDNTTYYFVEFRGNVQEALEFENEDETTSVKCGRS